MGLFSNDKKPCPLCGKATPKLLATKIAEETPICSKCSKNVSMESNQLEVLSVEGLKAHLDMREENAKYIESIFRPNKVIEVDFTSLNIDEENKVFTIPLYMCGDTDNPPVFKFEELIGYELLAKPRVVERFIRGDEAPVYIPMVFRTMTRILDTNAISLDTNCHFSLILYLTNPCWSELEVAAGTASKKYGIRGNIEQRLEELQMVTDALLEMMGSNARGRSPQDIADANQKELTKYKELLDAGVISQEEFDEMEIQLNDNTQNS